MRTLNFIVITFLFVCCACNSGMKTNAQKMTFGIYETLRISEVPDEIIDTLQSFNVQPENNLQQSIIGYITKADSSVLALDLATKNLKLAKTYYPADNSRKFYAMVAVKPSPVITIDDIQKTRFHGNAVEIHFTMKGSQKWAAFTKNNIGNTASFIIDNQIYGMPLINGEIKNGIAIINGLEDEAFAKYISSSLNASIP